MPRNQSEPEALRPFEFDQICELMHGRYGIKLRHGLENLVSARLSQIVREHRFSSQSELLRYVKSDTTGRALSRIVDALTTHHTSFFRETVHFDFLREYLANNRDPANEIRIWSAGCSTGEEAYSIACCALDVLGGEQAARAIQITATDISPRVLKIASRGIYADARFEDLSNSWRQRHLLCGQGHWGGTFRFKPAIRQLIRFGTVNLAAPFPGIGDFSVIFCRNVLIYFDKSTQEDVVHRLTDRLRKGGYLMLGHSEGVLGMTSSLEYVKPSIYRRAG